MTDSTNTDTTEAWPSYPTFTAQRAVKTLNDNPNLQLAPGAWVKRKASPEGLEVVKLCAVSLFVAAEKGLEAVDRLNMKNLSEVAYALRTEESYLKGLLDGFEHYCPPGRKDYDTDTYWFARLDGVILRYLIDDDVRIERHVQDLLRQGILVEGDS